MTEGQMIDDWKTTLPEDRIPESHWPKCHECGERIVNETIHVWHGNLYHRECLDLRLHEEMEDEILAILRTTETDIEFID